MEKAVGETITLVRTNPATGEPMHIAASKAPRFSAGARLKDAVKS